ncbi:hypothetical protein L1987_06459 [Smallanthus sonchifolius]|uniref:Uncharacterized protein n=1 Tax=Smallanthus sonchifolius TaxID=185202 RepID=A0ACB9JY65_9ASTR|nr:hypothetical protein L1987_06459 [Smallanthus sonchifolius]
MGVYKVQKDVLDNLNKAKYVPPSSSSASQDKDDTIKALEASVSVLKASIYGLQESEFAEKLEFLETLDDDVELYDEDEGDMEVEIEFEKDEAEVVNQTENGIEFNPKLLDTSSDIEGSLDFEQDMPGFNDKSEDKTEDLTDESTTFYKKTDMTKQDWIALKMIWWKEKPVAPPSPIQKTKYCLH